jgi:uncharacterized SAM-dependent methyltransferase
LVASVVEGFKAGALPSYAHYLTQQQAKCWHELARGFRTRASGDSAFDKAFAYAAQLVGSRATDVVAIGAGVAEKEHRLVLTLMSNQSQCNVTFIDISADLLRQAEATFETTSNVHMQPSVVADISSSHFSLPLPQATTRTNALQVFTLFGVTPGLTSSAPLAKIANSLQPSDLFLFSLNLIPEHESHSEAPHSLQQLASFYNSAAARAWLQEIFHEVGLNPRTVNWQVTAESATSDLHAVATVRAQFTITEQTHINWHGYHATFPPNHQIEVFRSHRHTSKSAKDLVRDLNLDLVSWQVSPSGEEGVALTRAPA